MVKISVNVVNVSRGFAARGACIRQYCTAVLGAMAMVHTEVLHDGAWHQGSTPIAAASPALGQVSPHLGAVSTFDSMALLFRTVLSTFSAFDNKISPSMSVKLQDRYEALRHLLGIFGNSWLTIIIKQFSPISSNCSGWASGGRWVEEAGRIVAGDGIVGVSKFWSN